MQHPLNLSRPDLSDKKVLSSGRVGVGMVSWGPGRGRESPGEELRGGGGGSGSQAKMAVN